MNLPMIVQVIEGQMGTNHVYCIFFKQRFIQHTIDVGKGSKKRQKQEINLKKHAINQYVFLKRRKQNEDRRQKREEKFMVTKITNQTQWRYK